MILNEFNKKWKTRIEHRFSGLEIDNSKVIEYLDKEFTKHIKHQTNFEFSQIKTKFSSVCVYANASFEQCRQWGLDIEKILNERK
tara:strand:+ start:347 stop:601 length:255 start_codon:yes stop_codon:yes gene_type:complete